MSSKKSRSEISREYQNNNREKVRAANRRYYWTHKESMLAQQRIYRKTYNNKPFDFKAWDPYKRLYDECIKLWKVINV